MAEPMNRRAALEKAWAERKELPVPMNTVPPATAHWAGFESGFNAAWDVLMAEVRPLVADLRTNSALRQSDMNEIINHRKAVICLRELAREGE